MSLWNNNLASTIFIMLSEVFGVLSFTLLPWYKFRISFPQLGYILGLDLKNSEENRQLGM
jgi:hypothetical protein